MSVNPHQDIIWRGIKNVEIPIREVFAFDLRMESKDGDVSFIEMALFKAHSFSRAIWTPLQAVVPASA